MRGTTKKDCPYWKKKAWKAFSAYIRQREANQDGFVTCITCDRTGPWKTFDAGHFVPGRNNSVLYHERLVHAQCKACNRNQGEQYKYAKALKKKYGYTDADIEKFLNLQYQTKPMYAFQHKEIYELYEQYLRCGE